MIQQEAPSGDNYGDAQMSDSAIISRLLIIDGNAIMHRAYHALPPLTDALGAPTNAVYGFLTMLLRLLKDLHPTHLAVAFDRPAPTFRKKMFEGYQAARPKMDDDLSVQIARVHEVLAAFAIAVFEHDGFEADDVIGTLVARGKGEGERWKDVIDQIIIVTGDRDILQLVEGEQVMVYMPIKGLTEAKLYGEKEVKEKLGVSPKQIPDYKGFAGDSSDNYPGVAGIGPKTTQGLIERFGSVESVYAALDSGSPLGVSENVVQKVKAGRKDAFLSKDLATIRDTAPIHVLLEDLAVPSFNTDAARKALHELQFHSLLKRLNGGEGEREERGKREGARGKGEGGRGKREGARGKGEEETKDSEQMGLF